MDLKLIGWSIFIIMYQCVFLSEAWHDQYEETYDDLTDQDDILSAKRLLKKQLSQLRNLYRNNHQYVQHSATSKSQRNDAKKPNPHETPRKETKNKSLSDQRSNNASVQDADDSSNTSNFVYMNFEQKLTKDEPKSRGPLSEAANEGNKVKSDAALKMIINLLPGFFPSYLEQLNNNTNMKHFDNLLSTTPSSYKFNEPDDSNESDDSHESDDSNKSHDYRQEYNHIKDQQQEDNQIKDKQENNQIKDEKNHYAVNDNSHDNLIPIEPLLLSKQNPHPPSTTTECPRETVYYPVPVYNIRPLPEYINVNPPPSENYLPDTSLDPSPGHLHPKVHDRYANGPPLCKSGSKWRRNCHDCICSPAGSPICLKIDNCQIKPPDTPMQCKPYSKYYLDTCNECECDGDGVPICTFLECPTNGLPVNIPLDNKSEFEKDSDPYSHQPPYHNHPSPARFQVKIKQNYHGECSSDSKLKRCAPDTRWQSECHKCTCNWKGTNYCVRIPNCSLPPSGDPGRCRPNTTFFDKCKRCSCDDEGRPFCENLCYNKNSNNYLPSPINLGTGLPVQ